MTDIRVFSKHMDGWASGKRFGSFEQMLSEIEAESRKVASTSCIARLASVSDRGPGYRVVVGDGGPFCYMRIYTKGTRLLSIERISYRKA